MLGGVSSYITFFQMRRNEINEAEKSHPGSVPLLKNGFHKTMFFRRASGAQTHAPHRGGGELFNLDAALTVFLALINSLRDVHSRIELHQAFCTPNIRINEDGSIELRNDVSAPLAYISPEQTGRMNRRVDYRSDYYSLGVVLYELLTGRLPFESDNVMELVHSHIAKQAVVPSRHNPEIPEVVGDIVLKLLAKNAEDRYQSLQGLLADLQQCHAMLRETGIVAPFPLGESDICDRLQIPQKLYGREADVGQLISALNRITGGGVEMLLVTGYSGIGKSSLVHEIHKPVVARRGYFVSGKFDQFKRNVPYSAINHAFRELMRQILTESESRIAEWRAKLVKALGPNAQLVIDAIPELEYIIGKQESVTLNASRNSYNYVMQNFVEVFTQPEHPLVLFLDDLQWADAASLKLISLLMKSLDEPCLLLIGAYRDNEVDAGHPLMMTIDDIRKEARVSTIEVKALEQASITELIGDTVKSNRKAIMPLAQLICRKTLGNPFFVGQFLKSLYNEHLLQFDAGRWHWDIGQIEALGITDNVIDLLMKELRRLPASTRYLLTLAACIGNHFDLKTLATVSEQDEDEARAILQQAIGAGLITVYEAGLKAAAPAFDAYYFSHDRVQQAAYEGIPEREKEQVHNRIGRLLLMSMDAEEREERIFDIVHQLNEGRALLSDASERDELARLNLCAAKKARQSAAFDVHRACIEIARDFGDAALWPLKQEFIHELYMELINAAFARADYNEMERLCQVVCDNSASTQEAIDAKDMLIRCYAALYKPRELLKTGIESLALAGIEVPRRLGRRHIVLARLRLKLALAGRDPLELANLPAAHDPQFLLQLRSSNLFLAYGFTYLADSKVVLWVALEMIRKSIRFGISPFCAYAYVVWARTLAGRLGKQVDGYKFGKVSTGLGPERYLLGTVGIFQGIIRHHQEHLGLSLQPLMDTYVKAMETGDRAGAMVALSFSDAIRFQSGVRIDEGLVQIRRDIGIYRKMDYSALLGVMIPWALLFSRLVGASSAEIGNGLGQEDYADARKLADDPWGVFYVRAIQSTEEYLFGEYAAARAHAKEAMRLPGFDFGTPSSGFLMFVYSLACLGMCDARSSLARPAIAAATKMQRRFKEWARHAPMNYLHKWNLVEAERWRVIGNTEQAALHYDLAIKGAREHRFCNDEALANELAGRFYLHADKDMIARMHMEEAHAKYVEWGAFGKARQLEELYPLLLSRIAGGLREGIAPVIGAGGQRLDMDTIIKASQTLSGEIQLDKLLEKLMRLLIANAGAQKGMLLLQNDGVLTIQAQARADAQGDTIEVRQALSFEESGDLSLAIVNFVRRTGEKVVLGDAGNDSQFSGDPYIERVHPKSVLCIPLQKQSELVGILYLENNLAADAFTPEHTELLEILSTQIAISLENAGLYTKLEQKIEARTQALRQKNGELNDTLDSLRQAQKQLVESEKLASLGQLVAGVAHEINTPVGVGVTGASTLAEETARLQTMYQAGTMKRSDLESYVSTAATISKLLLSNMERAATLIQSFKEVAIDQTSQERRRVELKTYIEEVLLNLSPMLRKTMHTVTVDCPDALDVDTYPGAISQVLTNFVMNALLHAFADGDHGKMAIVVRAPDASSVELRFSDNGKGIPQEAIPKIFDPFFTTMRGRGGSGLGLNIVHNLVTGTLQGKVTVDSTLTVGTTFILNFPRNAVNGAAAAIVQGRQHHA